MLAILDPNGLPSTNGLEIIAPDAVETDPSLGRGFEVPLGSLWFDGDNQQWHLVHEENILKI